MNDTFFAIPFSDLFRTESNFKILSIDLTFKIAFYKRKRLLNERIRDHITHITRLVLCLNCRERARWTREFVSKSEKVKNRSPNVWRNKLVLNVHGPTISSAGIKHMVQA